MTIALNLALMLAMIGLLITSVVVLRVVFGFLPFDAGMTARDLHLLSAYWGVVLVGLHVGLNWQIVMNVARSRFGVLLPRGLWEPIGWVAVLCLSAAGLHSAFTMDLGAKLLSRPTLDMWDFNAATPRFFLHWLSIMGLCAVLGHHGARLLRRPLTLARG